MENLIVEEINGKRHTLSNKKSGKKYVFFLTFFDCEVSVGDIIAIHKELLDPSYDEFSNEYRFGPLDEPYGRKVEGPEHLDFIAIKTQDKIIPLKRFFG